MRTSLLVQNIKMRFEKLKKTIKMKNDNNDIDFCLFLAF